jgi:hypothetical protein
LVIKKNKQKAVQKVFPLINYDEEFGYNDKLDYFKDKDYSLQNFKWEKIKKNNFFYIII